MPMLAAAHFCRWLTVEVTLVEEPERVGRERDKRKGDEEIGKGSPPASPQLTWLL